MTTLTYQKKCTMLDALCQGIESWWSVNSTDESKQLSRQAVETIMQWWREYIFENTGESAHHIMQAANWAGQAICITQTTAPHAFSYKITSLYGLPHGHAVAICLPVIWEYMLTHPGKCIGRRGQAYLERTFNDIALSMGRENGQKAVKLFSEILAEMELSSPVSANYDRDLCILSTSVNPIRLKNNPVSLDADTISNLYRTIVRSR